MISLGDSQVLVGTVLAVQANFYWVQLDVSESSVALVEPVNLLCTRRARLKKLGQRVMVGDRVLVEEPDWLGQRGAIAEVLPRQSELERPPVANAEQVLLVFAMADPPLDVYQLSRFLVAVESTGLAVVPCLSKADLLPLAQRASWCELLSRWGYRATAISVYTGEGISTLKQSLQHRITVLAGPSGVGKSSLINALAPALEVRVGEISEHWRRGKHTTRHVELFKLPKGGLLADTPGFSQPTLNCLPEQLIDYFPEGRERRALHDCQFKDCLHRDEPNCAIRGNWERYSDYLKFLDEVIASQIQLQQTQKPEARTKRKHGQGGVLNDEPILNPKRHRRTSRKTELQALERLYEEMQD